MYRHDYWKPWEGEPSTDRVCSHEGCENPAPYVGGHYTVRGRQVRLWVCNRHKVAKPFQEVPKPANIVEALRLLDEQYDRENRKLRQVDVSESIKYLAPTGHGKATHPDRVKSWRWTEKAKWVV